MTDDSLHGEAGPDRHEVRQATLHIDVNQLRAIAGIGVRRAAAFLAIGLNSTQGPNLPSLALNDRSMWRFFEEPAPEAVVREAVDEFRNWVIGNALRELDAYFNHFLDGVWTAAQFAKLHGQRVKSDFTPRDISGNTNAASKLSDVMQEVKGDASQAGRLRTLSNARNCLAHSAGIVTTRHANDNGSLKINWIGLEARLQQGGEYVVIPPAIGPEGLRATDPTKEAQVVAVVVERVKIFKVGRPIVLEPAELREICFFYQHLTEVVSNAFVTFLIDAGLAPPPAPAPAVG